MIRFLAGLLLAAVCAGCLVMPGSLSAAQESTPIVVLVEGCPMVEADLRRVAAFAGTPTAAHAEAPQGTPAISVPDGAEPDQATIDAVTDLIHLWIWCRNTNATLHHFAVYTDAFLRDMTAQYGPIPPELVVLEGGVLNPLPEALQLSLSEIVRMVSLDDGRVVVELVVIDPLSAGVTGATPVLPEEEMQVEVLLVARLVDGRWMVDGLRYGDQPYIGDLIPAE